jgi:uncharacterized FAD-dependent dehydrogenase
MIKELTLTVAPEVAHTPENLHNYIAVTEGIDINSINGVRVLKKSLDARRSKLLVNIKCEVYVNEPMPEQVTKYVTYTNVSEGTPVYIIGCGPAGMFAALKCIELGKKPIIIERGKNVQDRRRDLAAINRNLAVNTNSNYCFGEGGAGTYSDGKLYTRSGKRGSIDKILQVLVQHGADANIMVDAHPHIGTNKLPKIIADMRQTILDCGGEILFNTKLIDFKIAKDKITTLIVENTDTKAQADVQVQQVVLATGHSARDIFELLDKRNITIEAKTYALGVRVEHPQRIIDKRQYHCTTDEQLDEVRQYLGPAAYSWVEQVQGVGVYSFCMCPGGIIAPCATDGNDIVTNGWSPSKRDNPYANSGIVTTISEAQYKQFESHGALAALRYQQWVEQRCFEVADKSQIAPAQRLVDFCNNKISNSLPDCSYQPGLKSMDMREALPRYIVQNLQQGFKQYAKKMPDYYTNEALIVAPESRTSSPVRIPRDREKYHHTSITNLFPCGEGAGFAGGIVSAAIDGENCVMAMV